MIRTTFNETRVYDTDKISMRLVTFSQKYIEINIFCILISISILIDCKFQCRIMKLNMILFSYKSKKFTITNHLQEIFFSILYQVDQIYYSLVSQNNVFANTIIFFIIKCVLCYWRDYHDYHTLEHISQHHLHGYTIRELFTHQSV